jgi:hypothetical protein
MKQLQERAEFLLCVSPGGLSLHARTKSGGRAGPNLGQTVADGGDDAVVRVALVWHVASTLGSVLCMFPAAGCTCPGVDCVLTACDPSTASATRCVAALRILCISTVIFPYT